MASPTISGLTGRRMVAEFYMQQVSESGVESWQRDHADAMFASDVEEWVALFIGEWTTTGVIARNLHRRLRDNRLSRIEEVGHILERTLETFSRFGDMLAELVEAALLVGHDIAKENEFQVARKDVARELDRVQRCWPRRDPKQVEAAAADMNAGRYQDLGDVIRELQG